MLHAVRNFLRRVWNSKEQFDVVPTNRMATVLRNPIVRDKMVLCSVKEDEENPFYSNILDSVANDCLGPLPLIITNFPNEQVNEKVENHWLLWGCTNKIGTVLRQVRRAACATGVGIAVPYKMKNSMHPNPWGYKWINTLDLINPRNTTVQDRIYKGIEYDENWDPIKIHVRNGSDTKEYDIQRDDVLLWWKKQDISILEFMPECVSAFSVYPTIRRFLDAAIKAEEFTASIPLAIELDKDIYRPQDGAPTPAGKFEWIPGLVPTLPPGTKLAGINTNISAKERHHALRMMVTAASRCKRFPTNLAMGDSANSNMATAQIDIQPWKTEVKIDRFDFQPILHQVFNRWKRECTSRNLFPNVDLQENFYYSILFEHPDPVKNANSRAIDLASGSKTLSMIYADIGANPRRELLKEANLLGISREKLIEFLLVTRSTSSVKLINEESDSRED